MTRTPASRKRKQMIEEILNGFQAMRRNMVLKHKLHKSKLNITPSQWVILGTLRTNDTSTVRDMAKELSMSPSAVTQLVDGLVAKGYVSRVLSVSDKRTSVLTLSPKSRKRMELKRKEMLKRLSLAFKNLSNKELKQYQALSHKISKQMIISRKKI